ncbi:serum amyloid P-component-like [Oncorhynchus tshawytscha]|uniref:Pentraxin (PTX) domain-containing protein n=1 Tax=Oncorhynchus tshawytscha TaxID=74940 RepID=A0AAZ3Q6Y4_ONCTS|nr:serum amyloid P-component-like [Oncorhynchus tshawytscha]
MESALNLTAKLVFLLVLIYGCYGDLQDLSGKVFVIPTPTRTSHIKLHANVSKPISAMTMCQRFNSELERGQSLFSLATQSHDNDLLLYKRSMGVYRVHIRGDILDFFSLPDSKNEWISICWTWDSKTGLTQLWVNGKRSARRILKPDTSVTGTPSIMLVQEQDSYGGGFDASQSFVGEVTDVHFWDSVISPCEIQMYMELNRFNPGNILNWKDLQFSIEGKVFIEKSELKNECHNY